MTFKEFKTWLERENETAANIKSDCDEKGYYGSANFWIGYSKATEHILKIFDSVEPEEVQKTHNDFCWNKVKLGDKVELVTGKTGTVVELIYGENGFSGMTVLYDCFSGKEVYRNCEYKSFRRIGDWVNEE